MNRNWLVIYDIADKKRLASVAKVLLKWGTRVQKSVYEVAGNAKTFATLRADIVSVIDPVQDSVVFIPLCDRCKAKQRSYGTGARTTGFDEQSYVLL